MSSRPPLVCFSNSLERASLFNQEDSDTGNLESDMPARRRGGRRRKSTAGGPRRRRRSAAAKGGHRVIRGRVTLKIKGLGVRKVPSTKLVKFIAKSKLVAAAKRVYAQEIRKGRRVVKRRRRRKSKAPGGRRRRGAGGRFV